MESTSLRREPAMGSTIVGTRVTSCAAKVGTDLPFRSSTFLILITCQNSFITKYKISSHVRACMWCACVDTHTCMFAHLSVCMLGLEPRAFHMLDRHGATELLPLPRPLPMANSGNNFGLCSHRLQRQRFPL